MLLNKLANLKTASNIGGFFVPPHNRKRVTKKVTSSHRFTRRYRRPIRMKKHRYHQPTSGLSMVDLMDNQAVADALLDWRVNNAHRLEL